MSNKTILISRWADPVIQFYLHYINTHTYITIRSIRRQYLENSYSDKRNKRSIGIIMGIATRELRELNILRAWNQSRSNRTYKKIIKKDLFEVLEQYYTLFTREIIGEVKI